MNLHKLKVWINENSIEIHSGVKVIGVSSVIEKIEEMEEG